MPHYAVWRQAAAECLDGTTERTTFNVVFPRPAGSYWAKG
jgi:hypothetical protein